MTHADDWNRTLRIGEILGVRSYHMLTMEDRKQRGFPHSRAEQIAFLAGDTKRDDLFGPLHPSEIRR